MRLTQFALLLAIVALSGISRAEDGPGTFTLTFFEMRDVQRGAGLAVLLQTPQGKNFMYDTGNGWPSKTVPGAWEGNYNAGRDSIAPYLKEKKIEALDGIFISHAHYDHFGGLAWLVENKFPIKKLYDGGFEMPGLDELPAEFAHYAPEVRHYSSLREHFKKEGAYQRGITGDKLNIDAHLDVEVLAPPKEFLPKIQEDKRQKNDPPVHYLVNANSLMLRITHGKTVFLFPGDIQEIDLRESLYKIVSDDKLKCHVLVAPGHGIESLPEFAAKTRPEVTICSAVPRFALHSPSPEVYGKVGSKVYLTGIHGQIQIVSDGKEVKVSVEREGK